MNICHWQRVKRGGISLTPQPATRNPFQSTNFLPPSSDSKGRMKETIALRKSIPQNQKSSVIFAKYSCGIEIPRNK